jgi:hypothetical protein
MCCIQTNGGGGGGGGEVVDGNYHHQQQQQQQQQHPIQVTSVCCRSSSCDQRRGGKMGRGGECASAAALAPGFPNVRLRIQKDGQNLIELPIETRGITKKNSPNLLRIFIYYIWFYRICIFYIND